MDGWILSTGVWNVASHMVSVVVYNLIYLSFSKISFSMGFDHYRCVLDRIFLFLKLP